MRYAFLYPFVLLIRASKQAWVSSLYSRPATAGLFSEIMRSVLTAIFVLVFAICASAQINTLTMDLTNYGVRIEPDKRLMIVLATLEMANSSSDKLINTTLSVPGAKFRQTLQADMANVPPDLR